MHRDRLIRFLQNIEENLDITIRDNQGNLFKIAAAEYNWDSDKPHTITLFIDKVDEPCQEKEGISDEEFIDNVNKSLEGCEKIDKQEALKAKEVFDEDTKDHAFDFKALQNQYKEWYYKHYDKASRDAMKELFGDETPLSNKTMTDLKLHVYENGWQDELDRDELNNRHLILALLYRKLEGRTKELMNHNTKELWQEVSETKREEPEKRETTNKNLLDSLWLKGWILNSNKDLEFMDGLKKIFF